MLIKRAFSVTYDVNVTADEPAHADALAGWPSDSEHRHPPCRPRAALPPCAATAPTSLRPTAAIMKEQNAVLAAAGARMAGTPVRTSTPRCRQRVLHPSRACQLPGRIAPRPQGQPGIICTYIICRNEALKSKVNPHMLANQLRFNDEIKKYGGYVYNAKHAAKLLEAAKSVSASDEQDIANVRSRSRPSSRTPSRATSP